MKRETILSILLNVTFVMCIFAVRYFYVKKEYKFLKNDSQRQEKLIVANEIKIDSLSSVTRRLQINNDTQDKNIKRYSTDLYEIVKWSKEYEQRIENLKSKLEEMSTEIQMGAAGLVPFEKEFQIQDNYLRIFGRSGLKIKNDKILDYETNLSFDGEIKMSVPEIEKVGDTYTPFISDKTFDGLKLIGGRGKPLEIKPPRNQISFGPMIGVTYNQISGLTEPIWGFGITYNLVKLRDWR
tara:strand:+ start:846 stop:1562 length:717 start_codon:yes stop_codon:yes gene_type:complete